MSKERPTQAYEAAIECLEAAKGLVALASEVATHTSHDQPPTLDMYRRMEEAWDNVKLAAFEGRSKIEPLRFDLARVAVDAGAASSAHLLALRVAERLERLSWTNKRLVAYYGALTADDGALDYQRLGEIPEAQRVQVDSLIDEDFPVWDLLEAALDREYGALRGPGELPGPRLTALEERVVALLSAQGSEALTGPEIATRLKTKGGHLKTTLSSMRKRGILLNRPRHGYYLNPDWS